jgi:hypothetical protein
MTSDRGHQHTVRESAPVAVDDSEQERVIPRARTLGARMLILPIVAYRRWISPALPARCRFYPSCSAYAVEAISTHGALRGLGLATWRLLRCQPFNAGGYDPVPPRKN